MSLRGGGVSLALRGGRSRHAAASVRLNRRVRLVASAFLVCCLLVSAFPAAGADSPWVPKRSNGYEVKEGKIYLRHGDAGMVLESAGHQTVERYYTERGAEIGNPLALLGPEVGNGAVFLLTLINRTPGNVTFTPNYVLLRIKTDVAFAVDFTVLVGMMDQVDPTIRDILYRSIFHSPEVVPKNRVVSKFLIFPSIPPKAREIRLDFDSLFFEDKAIRQVFYFIKKD